MGLIIPNNPRELMRVMRFSAVLSKFQSDATPYEGSLPSIQSVLRAIRNSEHSNNYRASVRLLRDGPLKQPSDPVLDRIEIIKHRKSEHDKHWASPLSNRFVKAGQGIGVEIEFFVAEENQEALSAINGNRDDGVAGIRLVSDTTVSGHTNQEIAREREARCFFQYGKWARLYKVCQRLRDIGADTNRTCGLHVHLDCRDCSSSQAMVTRATRLRKALPWLWDMVPQSRRTGSYSGRTEGRYQAINTESYRRHSTVEVRMHSGTVNADKIRNWVELVRFVALRSGQGKRPTHLSTLQQFLSCNDAPEHLKQWAVARTNHFNPVDGTESEGSEETSE